jgi:DNA-directed RNA polymerase alpha subunit
MPDLEVPHVSAPADRALQEAGIRTLQDLSRHPATAIAELHGVGPKAMKAWTEALAQHGLEFAETEADAEGHPS